LSEAWKAFVTFYQDKSNNLFMTFKEYLLFILTFISVVLQAQDKTVHVDLEKNRTVTEAIFLGENGIVLKTGFPISSSPYPNILFYYSAEGELIWEKQIKGEYARGNDYVAASPNGEYVYFIEVKDYSGNTHNITQIKDGKEKTFKVEPSKGFGHTMQTVFCDNQYLYYLATQNGDELSEKKKQNEKLILIRFSHTNLTQKRVVLNLPPVDGGDANSFWSFIGQVNTDIYLTSKSMDSDNGKGVISIAVFNQEGDVKRNFNIDLTLNKKFTRPAWNASEPFENIIRTDTELKASSSAAPGMSGTSVRSVPTYSAFCFVKLQAGNLYLYGLTGPNPFRKIASEYDGFHVAKYDLQGIPIWKHQQSASKKLMDEGTFRVHALPDERDLFLNVLPWGDLNVSIHFKDKLYEYELSQEGKFITARDRGYFFHLYGNSFSTSENLKSDKFILKSMTGKKNSYDNFITSKGELVLRIDSKSDSFDLYYFKK
jgi:hypothetical protein